MAFPAVEKRMQEFLAGLFRVIDYSRRTAKEAAGASMMMLPEDEDISINQIVCSL
jgi:hypothetical protein